MMNFWN